MTSHSTNNLIGFLTKQSLFKTQAQRNNKIAKNQNHLSEEFSRSITPKNKNHKKSQISQFNVFHDRSQNQLQLSQKGFSEIDPMSPKTIGSTINKTEQKNRFNKVKVQSLYLTNTKQISSKTQNPQSSSFLKSSNNLFLNFKPQSPAKKEKETKTFESLQSQSQKCLSQLSGRLQKQISVLNFQIEQFNSKMLKILNSELQTVKDKIYQMVEEVFIETEKNLKMIMKKQQKILLHEVSQIRDSLQTEYLKVEQMKITIKTSQWRKTAAELIASDLDHKVQSIIADAQKISIPQFKVDKNAQNDKLVSFNSSLKDLINVQNLNNKTRPTPL